VIDQKAIDTVILDYQNRFEQSKEYFSATRDVFAARVQSFVLESRKDLQGAIIGEIGNNTFDHNFMFAPNYPWGVYCNFSYKQKYVVLADYGRGIRQSLLSVLPSLASDLEAIEAAFIKRISGRSPEQRGNGLKFVTESIKKNNWHLYFQSGMGSCVINSAGVLFKTIKTPLAGCLAIINFDKGI
jgi:hypothetical protein